MPRADPALDHPPRRGHGWPDRSPGGHGGVVRPVREGGGPAVTSRRDHPGSGHGAGRLVGLLAAASALAAVTLAASALLAGRTAVSQAVPACGDPLRIAIVAQSLPSAS